MGQAVASGDTQAIRAWAQANGHDVSDRGRIPATVTEAHAILHLVRQHGAGHGNRWPDRRAHKRARFAQHLSGRQCGRAQTSRHRDIAT
ncbi:MAG: histone-like nucleoid-structuring protein Lsr2 [Dietzia sp.]